MTLLVILQSAASGTTADLSWVQDLADLEGDTGLAAETDTALTLTADQQGDTGLAQEADAALALDAEQQADTGLAQEANTALALTGGESIVGDVSWVQDLGADEGDVGLAHETDSAFAMASSIEAEVSWVQDALDAAYTLGLAVETDTALALSTGGAIGITAQISWVQGTAGTPSTDDARIAGTWTPAVRSRWQILDTSGGVGLALEIDTALPRTGAQYRDLGLAVETDTALALAGTQVAQSSVGLARETDTAFQLLPFLFKSVGLAREIDRALTLLAGVPVYVREPDTLTVHAGSAQDVTLVAAASPQGAALRKPRRRIGTTLAESD